jgi:hypothetical protein
MSASAKDLVSLAFAKVVFILLCLKREVARAFNKALR